jgi:hypothetical protein
MKFFLNFKIKKFLFILILMLLIILPKIIFNSKKIKVCLCVLAKLENKYIIQYIEHYKKIGVDKMFIYDNNDLNGEKFDFILLEYIKKKYVEIINFRGKIAPQIKMLNDCYKKNNKNYDWFILFDSDEYIELKYFNNIKLFLNQKKFNKCQSIYLNWVLHTDNDLLYYDNRTLYRRFPEVYINKEYCRGKTIIKGNLSNITIESTHTLDNTIGRCNGFGKRIKTLGINCKKSDNKYNYIDHFYTKSTEEFINKINKGDAVFGEDKNNIYSKIKFYFEINKLNLEKINLIKQKTGLNYEIL